MLHSRELPFLNTGIVLAGLSESGNISFSVIDRLISLSRGMLIVLENCFVILVGMLLGPRASTSLSVLITSSIYLGDVGVRMKVFSISVGVVKYSE